MAQGSTKARHEAVAWVASRRVDAGLEPGRRLSPTWPPGPPPSITTAAHPGRNGSPAAPPAGVFPPGCLTERTADARPSPPSAAAAPPRSGRGRAMASHRVPAARPSPQGSPSARNGGAARTPQARYSDLGGLTACVVSETTGSKPTNRPGIQRPCSGRKWTFEG